MWHATQIRLGISKALYAIALMVFGADALAWYLMYSEPTMVPAMRDIHAGLQPITWLFVLAGSWIAPRSTVIGGSDISPRLSGVVVVLLTGFAASVAAAYSNYLYGLLAAAGTLIAAAAVWRFATAYAGDIGEARFLADPARD